jgi:hypothetical protein
MKMEQARSITSVLSILILSAGLPAPRAREASGCGNAYVANSHSDKVTPIDLATGTAGSPPTQDGSCPRGWR